MNRRIIIPILLITGYCFLPEVVSACEDCIRKAALEESQRNVDRSIDYISIVVMLIGILVALITVIIIIAIAVGLFERRKWKRLTFKVKKDVKFIEDMKERAKRNVEEASDIVKGAKILPDEEPTSEMMRNYDKLNRRLDMMEMLGVSFKAEDYHNRGVDLYYKEDNKMALQAFEKAIELKPDHAIAWYNKGDMLSKLGRNKEALKAYEKAIELKPDDADAWTNKGAVLSKLGRNEEALKAQEKAIELKPDYASAWYNKACAYSLMKDNPNALKSLSKAIQLDEKYKETARKDDDFKAIRDDEDFKKLTS